MTSSTSDDAILRTELKQPDTRHELPWSENTMPCGTCHLLCATRHLDVKAALVCSGSTVPPTFIFHFQFNRHCLSSFQWA